MRSYGLYSGIVVLALCAIAAMLGLGSPAEIGGVAMAAVVFGADSYREEMIPGQEGQIATANPNDVDTRTVESGEIPFGRAVCQGEAAKGCRLGAGAAAAFVGVSVRDVTLPARSGVTVDTFAIGDNAAIMTRGKIWVRVEAAVNPGDNVTFDATTGRLSSITAGGSNFAITGARWDSAAAAEGIARLQLTGSLPSA